MRFSSNRVRIGVVAIVLALFATFAAGQTSGVGATPVDPSAIHIDNFGRIDATYYRGAQPNGRDYDDLASLGVKTIVNLTSDDADPREKAMAERAGLKYIQIAMTTHESPTASQLTQFLTIVTDRANQPVFVHCVGGRHRTGVMTAAYRMAHDGWPADRAFAEMKRYKFGADVLHPEFKTFVYAYHPSATAATMAGGTR